MERWAACRLGRHAAMIAIGETASACLADAGSSFEMSKSRPGETLVPGAQNPALPCNSTVVADSGSAPKHF